MCVSIPGQITAIIDPAQRIAQVDISGCPRLVNLGLLTLDEGAVGDWVLVHAGLAVSRMDADEAESILTLLRQCAQLNQEEQL